MLCRFPRPWCFAGGIVVAALALTAVPTQSPAARAMWVPAVQAATPGTERLSELRVGGLTRTYELHVPPAPVGRALPLVVVLHGGGGTLTIARRVGFYAMADRRGFIVAAPQGIDGHWNDGREDAPGTRRDVDDVALIAALIDHVSQSHTVDARRIYVTGISNGGIMAHRLGCELSEKLAAIGPVAGSMPVALSSRCAPGQPVSVVAIHGTHDVLVPYAGGVVAGSRGMVTAVPESAGRWATLNGCPTAPRVTDEPDRVLNDGTRVRRATYAPCRGGTEVVLYAIQGGGHNWPGVPLTRLPLRGDGAVSLDVHGTEVIWEFFERHPKARG